MGTRADFYVGRGLSAEWLGSIAWDGYPDGIPDQIRRATDEAVFRAEVAAFLQREESATKPEDGWPWPWEDSRTTDYAYAFDSGEVFASCFGHPWFNAARGEPPEPPEPGDDDDSLVVGELLTAGTHPAVAKVEFPDMSARRRVTFGKRSGLIVIGLK